MWNGILGSLPWWGYILIVLAATHITIVSVTVFLHRHQAHRALELHPVVSHFFRFWLWLTTGMVTREWVAIHRKHHAKVEGPEDPHSPQVYGIRKVLLEGAELYRAETEEEATLDRYGKGTPDDWMERNVYQRFTMGGISLLLVLNLVLFGPIGLSIWGVQMLWIPFWAAGVINGAGHYWGYRNHASPDTSTNIVPWGIIIGGEELHNNHHAHAGSAKFSHRKGEFDIGWLYIRLMEMVGLARVKKVAPVPEVVAKEEADYETVRAVVANRFQVMARYSKDVMARVLKEEERQTDASSPRRSLLRRARAAVRREGAPPEVTGSSQLDSVFQESETLRTVQQYKERLQAIWKQSAATREQRLNALRDWCREAEATGIEALQEFAARLRGYTLPNSSAT